MLHDYLAESYKYLGLDTVVERDHLQTNINQTYISQNGQTGDAGDPYVGLDRFGRVVDDNWVNATTGQSTDRFQYGYDQDSDVLYRQNVIDAVMSELYQYNNLHELTSFQRGTLNATHDGIVGTPSRSQSWSPDALGNFDKRKRGRDSFRMRDSFRIRWWNAIIRKPTSTRPTSPKMGRRATPATSMWVWTASTEWSTITG